MKLQSSAGTWLAEAEFFGERGEMAAAQNRTSLGWVMVTVSRGGVATCFRAERVPIYHWSE